MKYLLMIQGTQADYDAMSGTPAPDGPAWTREDLQAMLHFMQRLNEDLAASGEFLDGQGLSEPSQARVVSSAEDGRPVLSDAAYGVREAVPAGYWMLRCESLERATEIAARIHQCPVPAGATNHPVIVRPLQEEPPVA